MYGKSVLFSCRVVSVSIRHKSSSRSTKKLLDVLAEMPKANSARISEAQRQRQNISKKSEKYAPSTVYLQVLGSGARGAPNSLYVFTDQKRYLFNCGESTQRLAHEHKVKLSRLEHIFITSKTWMNIGGLPGLSLTLQDVGVPNLTLHGPEGLDDLYQATKRFVIMKDMHVTMAKSNPAKDFEDNVMSVKYVLLGAHEGLLESKPVAKKPRIEKPQSREMERFINDDTDYYSHESKPHMKKFREQPRKLSPEKDPNNKLKTEKVLHDLTKRKNVSVAYICTLKKRLGTLDLAKCVESGVPPGPLLGQLKAGFDVVLADGKLVVSKDVKTPDDPGPVFIVLEVPELSYLKETEFSAHFDTDTNPPERIATLVVHYTPPHVFKEPKYRQFMAMFGPDCKHLVLNSQNSCLGSEAVHRTQHKLHLLDPDIFPLLRDATIPAVWNTSPLITATPTKIKGLEELKNKIALAQFQNIITMEGCCKGDATVVEEEEEEDKLEIYEGRTLSTLYLRPKKEIDRSAEPKLHVQEYIQETMDIDGFVGSLEAFRKQVDSIRYLQSEPAEFPKVVFLGTGSCIPSKTRNTSGIVLQMDENKSMLLDCGEGTFGQLVRFFGPKRVNSFLRSLRAIYISHLHADHHIGLIGIIQARRQAFKNHPSQECHAPYEPVYLLAPGQIMSWLTMYDQQFEKINQDFKLIPNQNLLYTEHTQGELTAAALASIGVQQIKTCLVAHCPNAFGVAVDVDQEHRITYSGDTIPCEELVKIGDKSTLLIHEATMEDELAEEARVKMHSTTSQAIEQGRLMRAKYTVLTHFSQRYARLPRLNAHMLNHNQSVGIAFDNMQITMSDLKLLPLMYAPLQLMFAEHCVEMEQKAAHRARLRERGSDRSLAAGPKENRKKSRTRSRSRCRTVESAPRPTAHYWESNASRLRQEMKGMTMTGVLRNPRSASATLPTHTKTYSRPSSTHSGSDSSNQPELSPFDSVSLKSEDLNYTPRTISNTSNSTTKRKPCMSNSSMKSNADSCGNKSSILKNTDDLASYNVSGTSSRTIASHEEDPTVQCNNSLGKTQFATLNKPSKVPRYAPVTAFVKSAPTPEIMPVTDSGYGKPLVTNLNKRLKIMRYTPTPILFNDKEITKMRQNTTKSPVKSMKSNLKDLSSGLSKRPDSKIPTKTTVSGNKLRASVTNPSIRPEKKCVVENRPESARSVKPSSLSSSPKRQTPAPERNVPVPIKDVKMPRSPERRVTTRQIAKETPKKPFEPLRDIVTERLKQPLCKGKIVQQMNRPHSAYHSKTYKPQLEDIKSSFLLLNKQAREQSNKKIAEIENEKQCPSQAGPSQDPPPFKENERRKQLMQAKKKFQSRGFFLDSKYDKIEGLNWISWK